MSSFWDDEERRREWPIESLSAWAAAVVDRVERSGGNGESAYCSMYELADTLGMWEGKSSRGPGQVWTEADLRETRRRFAHLLGPMRESSALVPEHPVWITLQLVDLLNTRAGLPVLSDREIERRTRYLKLQGTVERLIRTRFDLDIAMSGEEDGPDSRRPETADEGVVGLMDTERVRSRTLAELADDLREEAARSSLPHAAVDPLTEAALLAERDEVEAASTMLGQVEELLYDEMATLGDFRTPISD
jgi:hypothetical protein